MKKLMLVLVAFICLLSACSQGPDFTKKVTITRKEVHSWGAEYSLDNDGVRGNGWGCVVFKAPNDFAHVGDDLVCKEGVISIAR